MIKNFITVIAWLMVALLTGCSSSDKNNAPLTTTTIRADKTTLEISTPFKLKDDSISVPNELDGYFKKVIAKDAEENNFAVTIVGYVCDKEKIETATGQPFTPNIEGAVIGAVGNIKTVRTSSDVMNVEINGVQGKEIEGTLDLQFKGDSQSTRCDFRARAFGKGMEVWGVIIIRKPGDENKRVSDAIFNSLKML